jgi:hypothetical protein
MSILTSRWTIAVLAATAVSPQVRRLLRRSVGYGAAGAVAAGKGAYGAVRWVTGEEAPSPTEEQAPAAKRRRGGPAPTAG